MMLNISYQSVALLLLVYFYIADYFISNYNVLQDINTAVYFWSDTCLPECYGQDASTVTLEDVYKVTSTLSWCCSICLLKLQHSDLFFTALSPDQERNVPISSYIIVYTSANPPFSILLLIFPSQHTHTHTRTVRELYVNKAIFDKIGV